MNLYLRINKENREKNQFGLGRPECREQESKCMIKLIYFQLNPFLKTPPIFDFNP